MTPQQRTILRNYALAALGAGAVAVSLFFGGFDPETNTPTPITVDGQTINFTWTDDNTDETLLIYTDQQNYNNGFSQATVYAAVTNMSGIDQDVSLMGSFVNQRRYIKDVSVLTEATFASTSTDPGTCRELTGKQLQSQIDAGGNPDDYFITDISISSSSQLFNVCTKVENVTYSTSTEWVALPQTKRDIYEAAIEQGYIDKLGAIRKTVDGYIAENKTLAFPIKAGQTMYYKLELAYPANDSGNFFLEAVGSEGAYGHLDPWFDAAWGYRVAITVDDAQVPSTQTSFPVYVDLSDLPASFFTNAKSDGCDIRVVESDETTETAFELVSYSAGGTGELHFMADSLTGSGGGDTVFYIYYGNSGASCYATTDTYGAEAVWTNYVLKYPYEGNSSDSSGSHDGSNTSVTYSAGRIGQAAVYAGGSSYTTPGGSVVDGVYSYSFWIKTSANTGIIYSSHNTSAVDYFKVTLGTSGGGSGTNGKISSGRNGGSGWSNVTQTNTVNSNTWVHMVAIVNGTSISFYKNGSSDGSGTISSGTFGSTPDAEGIASISWALGSDSFVGSLDNFGIYNGALTANWVTTEYNNQSNPGTFYTVGSEEAQGGGAARRIIQTQMQ